MKKPWFECKAAADGASAEIYIFGLIGDWIDDYWGNPSDYGVTTAKSFADALAKLPESVKTLKVRINSPGGDVFGGTTIANALRAQQEKGRKVETIVEGLAASAASVIAMGGSVVLMADNALMMVHAPWSYAAGNAKDMRATADLLDQIRDTLVKTYQWHSDRSEDEILALIDGPDGQGTWLDADAAIEAGLATEKITGLKAAASIDPTAAAKLAIPDQFKDRVAALLAPTEDRAPGPVPVPAPAQEEAPKALDAADVVRLCTAAALDLTFAAGLIEQALDGAGVEARVQAEKSRRTAEATRETEIRALCAAAKQNDLAAGYISGGMSAEAVRAQLVIVTAKLDKVEIDAGLTPDHGASLKPVIDTAAVYRRLNAPAASTKH